MTLASALRPTHLRPGKGRRRRVITDLMTLIATADDTGGAYTLIVTETPPGGGFPPHRRRHEDLTLFVLDGAYSALLGNDTVTLESGGYAFVPRGTRHGYVNAGSTPARMLALATPGGVPERFLDAIADEPGRAPWAPDMARVLAVAPAYGIEIETPDDAGDEGGAVSDDSHRA
jgi:quercetin dioxygenase-like cupin family protein